MFHSASKLILCIAKISVVFTYFALKYSFTTKFGYQPSMSCWNFIGIVAVGWCIFVIAPLKTLRNYILRTPVADEIHKDRLTSPPQIRCIILGYFAA
jgi:Ni/Fe-hydrogenase subunit HybB-like protein